MISFINSKGLCIYNLENYNILIVNKVDFREKYKYRVFSVLLPSSNNPIVSDTMSEWF